jgi:hypothetical protein
MAGSARAEHKLLITDVLEQGEVEAEAAYQYTYSNNNFTVKPPFSRQGEAVHRSNSTALSLDAGLGHDLQLGISIPYFFSDRVHFAYSAPIVTARDTRTEGWGDFTLSAKYRLLGGSDKPFTLVTGLNVKLDTANADKEGSGTTNYAPYLAASTTALGGKLRPYATYRAIVRNHEAGDTHILATGAEYGLYKRLSLVPSFNVNFHTGTATLEGYESYSVGMSSYVQMIGNFYLIPSVSYVFSSSTRTKDKTQDLTGLEGYCVSLGLYYLFN